MEDKKEILSFILKHENGNRKYFNWDLSMIWILLKYKLWYNMDITFTVTKYTSEDTYLVQFFAE